MYDLLFCLVAVPWLTSSNSCVLATGLDEHNRGEFLSAETSVRRPLKQTRLRYQPGYLFNMAITTITLRKQP